MKKRIIILGAVAALTATILTGCGLLTEDPTYITNYNNARSRICKIDRDELMQVLVREYLFKKD